MRRKLHILHTNDIHSHFEKMPKIAGLIDQLRQQTEADACLTLDIGDHMDRMAVETEGTEGMANIDVMIATGYDLVTIGNNEGLTMTPKLLLKRYEASNGFDVVCGNVLDQQTLLPPNWMYAYRILNKAEMRIGVMAMTANFSEFYKLLGWETLDPLKVLREQIEKLRPEVDLLILMSHLGVIADREIAKLYPEIDLILGAHTHHLFKQPEKIGQTYLCAAGKFGQYVGSVMVDIDLQNHCVANIEGECLPVDSAPIHSDVLKIVEDAKRKGLRKLYQPVMKLNQGLSIDWDGESSLGNLLADGLANWTGAPYALVNAGQILGSLLPGDVREIHLLQICPSPINPCRGKILGEDIRLALQQCLQHEYSRKAIQGFGFRGYQLGTLCLSGIECTWRTENGVGHIEQIKMRGDDLVDDRFYDIGFIDMFTFGSGYTSLQHSLNNKFFMPEFLRDVLRSQLCSPNALRDCMISRWLKLKI